MHLATWRLDLGTEYQGEEEGEAIVVAAAVVCVVARHNREIVPRHATRQGGAAASLELCSFCGGSVQNLTAAIC